MTIDTERNLTREGVLEQLREVIASGRPVIGAGCSAGIVARAAEEGGADLIIVYSTGKSRLMGLPTTPIGHSNPITMEMYAEIDNVVERTPIIGGVEAGDPTYQRLPRLVRDFREAGFDGVINFPSVGRQPEWAKSREHVGQGLKREAELIAEARSQGLLTLGYAYFEEHARLLVQAGVDILVPHSGWTTGGAFGASDQARSITDSITHTQHLIDVARKERPEVICLAHGGSIATPEDTEELYRRSGAQGFVGASSIERIPIENAIRGVVQDFRSRRLGPAAIEAVRS